MIDSQYNSLIQKLDGVFEESEKLYNKGLVGKAYHDLATKTIEAYKNHLEFHRDMTSSINDISKSATEFTNVTKSLSKKLNELFPLE